MHRLLILGTANFFINLCVYSAHNYMFKIIQMNTKLTEKQYSVLDMFLFVKFIGAFFWTNLADRTKKHQMIIIIGLLGYAFFFCALKWAPKCMKAEGLNFFTYFYKSVSVFFLSGVFATMDALTLDFLEKKNQERKWYGRIKMLVMK